MNPFGNLYKKIRFIAQARGGQSILPLSEPKRELSSLPLQHKKLTAFHHAISSPQKAAFTALTWF